MTEVLERIEKQGDFLAESGPECERLGRLTDEVADRIRWTGVTRLLQPAEFGGDEVHPVEFFEAVLAVGARSGAAGWVSSVVGVHPWEMAMCDHDLQQAVWGEDPDTWIASPYAPMGRAKPEGEGWLLSGRWSFSSGTDHCQWIFLGGMLTDADGVVADPARAVRHFILPRSDYEIVADSWDVIGLEGTGSKDIVIKDAYISPDRLVDPQALPSAELRRTNPLYRMPFPTMFSGAITAGTLAIAEGALHAFVEHTRERVDARGAAVAGSPHQLAVLGAASSDIAASRLQFLNDINRVYEAGAKDALTPALRLEVRRNQVRSVRRAVDAVDELFMHAGGGALRRDLPFQRFWRDLHAAMNHINNAAELTYEGYGLQLFGQPVPAGVRY
ncbi:hydroxylase [Nocardioides sp. cx-173]|uniref:hydroxylase n=1 Tax=Nocardioides sp. cx-173 TaxID=2898796 RepID=UPI001E636722|nr:hydroxylase [Nocardioides sp. cx-173]MCD4526589.1 hydroxylase [Nocardioides sp. cx-173]UGB40684.1 hydroxylase [Nocardioides sp. cx-173]